MRFWQNMPTWLRWSFLASVLAALILLSNAKTALNNLHSWLPVTWGALEAWADEALDKPLEEQTETGLETKIAVFDLQIQGGENSLFMLDLRLQETPKDRLILERRGDVQKALDTSVRLRRTAECELAALRGRPLIGC